MPDVLTVVGAAVITLVFRLVPFVLVARGAGRERPAGGEEEDGTGSDLSLLPLAVLTALIVPGALTVDQDDPRIGLVAALAAAAVVLLRPRSGLHLAIGAAVLTGAVAILLTR